MSSTSLHSRLQFTLPVRETLACGALGRGMRSPRRRVALLLLLTSAFAAALRPSSTALRPVQLGGRAPTSSHSSGASALPHKLPRLYMSAAAALPGEESGGGGWRASLPISINRHTLSVAAVLAAAFLNLLGFTMAGPITPALGSHFGLNVGASLGWLTSAYPLGMLGGLVLWPALSDRIGRKPVITLSLLGSGVGLAAQGLAVRSGGSLTAFLILRAITGSMAGASPVAKAYLADVGANAGQLPRYMAWRDAASTLAFIVGPLLSGSLYLGKKVVLGKQGSLAAVITTSGIYSLVAGLLVALCVSETPPTPAQTAEGSSSSKPKRGSPPAPPAAQPQEDVLVACPLGNQLVAAVATVCVISALFNAGSAPFDAFFPSLVKDVAGLDEGGIGKAKAALATLSLFVSATLSARTQKRFGAVVTCVAGLSFSALGLAALSAVVAYSEAAALSKSLTITLFWAAAAIYQLGVPLFGPTIPTMLLQCVPRQRRGAVMGLDSSLNTVARIVSAPLLGALYGVAGPAVCFGTASAVLFASAATTVIRRFYVMRGLYQK